MVKISIPSILFNLQNDNNNHHTGEYYKVVFFKGKFLIYYNYENHIKVTTPGSNIGIICLKNVMNSGFCIIKKNGMLYMLCGGNIKPHEFKIDFPKIETRNNVLDKKAYIYDPTIEDKKMFCRNGVYLLSSQDGLKWRVLYKKPTIISNIINKNIKLGDICFDTLPGIIKFNGKYYYYGRLNPSRQERLIYLRKSNDLVKWEEPIKIKITDPKNIITKMKTPTKKNYYHLVPFLYKNKLYGCTPYFECSSDIKNNYYYNGCTLILQSSDGINWLIRDKIMEHSDKYKDRITDVLVKQNKIYLFFRENVSKPKQNFLIYNFNF